jgi:serine protease AprX
LDNTLEYSGKKGVCMKWTKQTVGYWCPEIVEQKWLGQGVGVAVLDTGISLHPDFDKRILGFRDFVNHDNQIYDDGRHGTHVAGIVAGSGKMSSGVYSGMAPRANLFVGKVLDYSGNGSVQDVLDAVSWIGHPRNKRQIRVVNISVGTQPNLEESQQLRLLEAVDWLWDQGFVVVVSAGNYGPGAGTIAVPGTSKKVITVGSLQNLRRKVRGGPPCTDASYSGQGPTKECIVKPDVYAPGSNILSCNGDYVNRWQKAYITKSGTSMATPVVSGAIACLLSKYPDLTNVEVKLMLRESCVELQEEQQGWGLLHVGRLFQSIHAIRGDFHEPPGW